MCEGQFRAFGDCAEPDLDARHAGVFLAAFPTPTHCDAFGPDEFEIFAAALVLGAVEHAEAHAVAAAHAYVRLRQKHRPRVRTPPLRDAFGRGDSIENDRRPRLDATHERERRHRPFLRASPSLASA